MDIQGIYDPATSTLTYVVYDPESRDAVVIDPVLDYDPAASATSTESVDRVVALVQDKGLRVHLILETHPHADHLSGSQELKRRFDGATVAIGRGITAVQETFRSVFGLPETFPVDGSQFDRLLDHGDVVTAGSLSVEVIHTPGHTPACVTYRIGDAIFTGDAMFMPDMGTGRCDFPKGSAEDLYESITTRLYTLPDETRVFVGHDYQPGGRELAFESTIAEQKASNIQLPASRSREDYVQFREARDAKLGFPRLLFQSVQVNIDAGRLPAAEGTFLRIPINAFRPDPDAGPIVEGDAR